MAGRSRSELEQIRAANRRALGMAGTAPCSQGMGSCCASCARGGHCDKKATTSLGDYTGQATWARAIPGMGASPLSFAPDVRIVTEFPRMDVVYSPGAEEPVQQPGSGGWVADWLTRHVVRPAVYVGPIRVAPYEREVNYAPLAEAVAIGVGVAGALFGGWIFYRAFAPRSA